MATISGSLPATGSVGQRQRATARLANISWVSGVVSFFLIVCDFFPLGLFGLDDTGQMRHDLAWLFYLVYGLFIASLVLGIVAVVAGILVLRRARRGVETASRNTAILGMVVGGIFPVFMLVPVIQMVLAVLYGKLIFALRGF